MLEHFGTSVVQSEASIVPTFDLVFLHSRWRRLVSMARYVNLIKLFKCKFGNLHTEYSTLKT